MKYVMRYGYKGTSVMVVLSSLTIALTSIEISVGKDKMKVSPADAQGMVKVESLHPDFSDFTIELKDEILRPMNLALGE